MGIMVPCIVVFMCLFSCSPCTNPVTILKNRAMKFGHLDDPERYLWSIFGEG